jgi:hypothetical protein
MSRLGRRLPAWARNHSPGACRSCKARSLSSINQTRQSTVEFTATARPAALANSVQRWAPAAEARALAASDRDVVAEAAMEPEAPDETVVSSDRVVNAD